MERNNITPLFFIGQFNNFARNCMFFQFIILQNYAYNILAMISY